MWTVVKAVLKGQKRHKKPQWDIMLPLPQQLLKNSSWIDFFLKHTLSNSQDLLWKETRGEKSPAKFMLICVGELLGPSSVFLCTFRAAPLLPSGGRSTTLTGFWHAGMSHQARHLPRECDILLLHSFCLQPFFQWHKDLTKPLRELSLQGE